MGRQARAHIATGWSRGQVAEACVPVGTSAATGSGPLLAALGSRRNFKTALFHGLPILGAKLVPARAIDEYRGSRFAIRRPLTVNPSVRRDRRRYRLI
ncbi:unnamed protein product, partial [Iphiclides podalirius]